MKPAWDQLGSEYASSSSVVVADVDCTVESDLCGKYDVKGYPTIKYFTSEVDEKGADYQGGRDFDSLKSFVSETLEVKCLIADTSGCSEKEVEFMGKWKEKPKADVNAQFERLEKMMASKMTADLKKWLVQRISILKLAAHEAAGRPIHGPFPVAPRSLLHCHVPWVPYCSLAHSSAVPVVGVGADQAPCSAG